MKRWMALLCLILLLGVCSVALGEAGVQFTPENPRVGDYVDVTVTPGREDPQEITWTLMIDGEKSIAYKPENKEEETKHHLTASFRPRQEGTYTLSVTLTYRKDDVETVEIPVTVAGTAPEQEGPDVVYSQKDGWWYRKWYAKSYGRDLQKAGCAIFTLSHLLQRMGFTGEEVQPEKLGKAYSNFYTDKGGTYNPGLIDRASKEYGFLTQKDLLKSTKEIAVSLRMGDRFSFGIVDGHIALADGISEDGTKVHVVDSAPGATFSRIQTLGSIFFRNEDGTFTEAAVPGDLPGIRWFFETQEYGGAEYWMSIDYCASRGMRLVRVPWLRADLGDDGLAAVSVDYVGALMSKVTSGKTAVLIPTRDLNVLGSAPQIALVTAKNGTSLKDGNGKKIANAKQLKRQAMALILVSGEDSHYVLWDGIYGYVSAEDVTVLPASEEPFETGITIKNKNTSGALQVTLFLKPDSKSTGLAVCKTGTPVAFAEKQDGFCLVEAQGRRGWLQEQFIQPDPKEETEGSQENGQKIDEGK